MIEILFAFFGLIIGALGMAWHIARKSGASMVDVLRGNPGEERKAVQRGNPGEEGGG